MRYPRCKRSNRTVWYLVGNKAAGVIGANALADPRARRSFVRLLRRDGKRFPISVASFSVLPNGFQLTIRVPRFRKLARSKLRRLAKRFYKTRRPPYLKWNDEQWEAFNHRLFDLSAFMGSLEGDYAQWHNPIFGRQGRFWAGRFWSTLFEDLSWAREGVLLAELKPVHMGLADRPEAWQEGSARLRRLRRDRWLLPLGEIFAEAQGDLFVRYRGQLLRRVSNSGFQLSERAYDGTLCVPRIGGESAKSGAPAYGYYAALGHWLERGVVAGQAEQVQPWLDWLKSRRVYVCREQPAPVPGTAALTVLRAARAGPML